MIKTKNVTMKTKLFFFFLLAITLKGFSQEKVIEIQPQKEFTNSVTLIPVCGKGDEITLPFTVFWDKKAETLKIDFKNNKNADKMLFFFPKRMFIKEILKLRKDVYFAKEIQKCQFKKTVNAGIDLKELVNVEMLTLDIIQTLDFEDKNTAISSFFNKTFQNNGDIVIPFHLYVASKENAKDATKENTKKTPKETTKKVKNKIEYEAIFTLIIKKRTETNTQQKNTAPTPKDGNKVNETVNCKTLYKANEQLAELLLDIKNSNPSNLTSLKQKYEKIKKSVANPEYKKCKEEHRAFESLCSKIDNRLK